MEQDLACRVAADMLTAGHPPERIVADLVLEARSHEDTRAARRLGLLDPGDTRGWARARLLWSVRYAVREAGMSTDEVAALVAELAGDGRLG